MVPFVDGHVTAFANVAYWIYDIFVNVTFIVKLLVILFFIKHFIKKTQNIYNIFFCILFIGFIVDIVEWTFDRTNRYCHLFFGTEKHPACWYLHRIDGTYSHFNNTFSSFWILLISVNRLTAIIWPSTKYEKIWSSTRSIVISIFYLFISPWIIIGYSFVDYRCRFYLDTCADPYYWVTYAKVTGFGNGGIATLTILVVLFAAIKKQRKYETKNDNQNLDVKLILLAAITSIIAIIHYIFFYIVQNYYAYAALNKGYQFDLKFAIIDFFKNMLYPGYHFSAYLFLFVFSQFAMLRNKRIFVQLTKLARIKITGPNICNTVMKLTISAFYNEKPLFVEEEKPVAAELIKKSFPLINKGYVHFCIGMNRDQRQAAQISRSGLQYIIDEFEDDQKRYEELKPIFDLPAVKCLEADIKAFTGIPNEDTEDMEMDLTQIPPSHFWWFFVDDEDDDE